MLKAAGAKRFDGAVSQRSSINEKLQLSCFDAGLTSIDTVKPMRPRLHIPNDVFTPRSKYEARPESKSTEFFYFVKIIVKKVT